MRGILPDLGGKWYLRPERVISSMGSSATISVKPDGRPDMTRKPRGRFRTFRLALAASRKLGCPWPFLRVSLSSTRSAGFTPIEAFLIHLLTSHHSQDPSKARHEPTYRDLSVPSHNVQAARRSSGRIQIRFTSDRYSQMLRDQARRSRFAEAKRENGYLTNLGIYAKMGREKPCTVPARVS